MAKKEDDREAIDAYCHSMDEDDFEDFTMNELVEALRKGKIKKAADPDGLALEMLQCLLDEAKAGLAARLSSVTAGKERMPDEWRQVAMVMLTKM